MNGKDYNFKSVQRAREDAGFRHQHQVAAILRVTYKTVSRVETGAACSYELLKRMAELYNVPLFDWLYNTSNTCKNLCEKTPSNADKALT